MPRASYEESPSELSDLGAAIRDLRKSHDLKQIELATAAGLSESQVSDIERGKNNPGWLLVMKLLDGMGVTVSDLADAYQRARER